MSRLPPRIPRLSADWLERRLPTAHAIARELVRDTAILNLRTRALERDIRERFGCATSTAQAAIGIARRADKPVDSLHVEHS